MDRAAVDRTERFSWHFSRLVSRFAFIWIESRTTRRAVSGNQSLLRRSRPHQYPRHGFSVFPNPIPRRIPIGAKGTTRRGTGTQMDAGSLGRGGRRRSQQRPHRHGDSRGEFSNLQCTQSRLYAVAPTSCITRPVVIFDSGRALVPRRHLAQSGVSKFLFYSRTFSALHIHRPSPRRGALVFPADSRDRVDSLDPRGVARPLQHLAQITRAGRIFSTALSCGVVWVCGDIF